MFEQNAILISIESFFIQTSSSSLLKSNIPLNDNQQIFEKVYVRAIPLIFPLLGISSSTQSNPVTFLFPPF